MSVCNRFEPGVAWVSWNVRGLNNIIKRNKVFIHLDKLKTKIAYLQETHLLNKEHNRFKRGGFTQIYHSNFNARGRAVAILMHRDVSFEETSVIRDRDGRFIIVQGNLFNIPVVLANIYAPNWDDMQFFKNLFSLLPCLDSHNIIIGGDFNCVLDSSIDRSNPIQRTGQLSNKAAHCINLFMQTYGVADPWRVKNPTLKKFSCFSPPTQVLFKNRLLFIGPETHA